MAPADLQGSVKALDHGLWLPVLLPHKHCSPEVGAAVGSGSSFS